MKAPYYTFTFEIDPDLNHGFDEAFNQGGESWWHYEDSKSEFPKIYAGGTPNLTGAVLLTVHNGNEIIYGQDTKRERS